MTPNWPGILLISCALYEPSPEAATFTDGQTR